MVRDLHDGAQQRLVHTIITLKLARRALQNEQEDATALLTEALDNAEQATAELRELAHGILPTALTEGGLRAGVDALASRMPVPVENGVLGRPASSAVEATALLRRRRGTHQRRQTRLSRAERAAVTARVEDGTLPHRPRPRRRRRRRPGHRQRAHRAQDPLAALDGEPSGRKPRRTAAPSSPPPSPYPGSSELGRASTPGRLLLENQERSRRRAPVSLSQSTIRTTRREAAATQPRYRNEAGAAAGGVRGRPGAAPSPPRGQPTGWKWWCRR